MNLTNLFIGIDPGNKTCGYAELTKVDYGKFKVEYCHNYSPRSYSCLAHCAEEIISRLDKYDDEEKWATVERFVPYAGTDSAEMENINRLIGCLEMGYFIEAKLDRISFFRAIDWKTKLVSTLNMHYGFENPSTSLDKKFSLAAAKHIVINPEEIKNDHEADAICLAAFLEIVNGARKPN